MTNYPGRPPQGKVLWGASLGSQDPVTRHEEPAGTTMELHRLFYRWNHVDSGWALRQIGQNIDAGRFPWVSFKLPGSWLDVAAGQYDQPITDLLEDLDAFGTPIWLTMHHEPEGGGGINDADEPSGPEGHKAMSRRIRQLMTDAGTTNIAFAIVLMGWTWDPRSGRDPDEWWPADTFDFLGIDHYTPKEATLLNDTWHRIEAWARNAGVDIAVGEWGLKGDDAAAAGHLYAWYDNAVTRTAPRITALAAFDVPGDWHQGPWVLEGAQLDAFHEVMRASAAYQPVEPEPEQRFKDVPHDHLFHTEIDWMAATGITRGCNPPANDLFCPEAVVTREQMAAFLYRYAHPEEGQ